MTRRLHALALAAALAALPAVATGAERLRLVVHPSAAVRALSREQVARLFLGKALEWSDGTRARPIDQRDGSAIRDAFAH
ncbi:MAG: hypothetical protein ACJ79L_00960, partial [Anaeromyxobacteraceae bacterium]